VILADTSAWVEFDCATGSPADRRITALVGTGRDLATTEPVVMEVLAGARTEARSDGLRRMLGSCRLLPFDAVTDFEAAARVYRRCRSVGVTPRGLFDCMVAAVALRTRSSLLAHDADLVRIAGVVNIMLDPGSLS